MSKMTIRITVLACLIITAICGLLYGCPQYFVYTARKDGEAELSRAEYNRKIAIVEAEAKQLSAEKLAQADTLRAHGIARSNQIIGQSLTKNYLHWFWIDNIDKSSNVIYVPTEANMPVMEASRFTKNNTTSPPADTDTSEEK